MQDYVSQKNQEGTIAFGTETLEAQALTPSLCKMIATSLCMIRIRNIVGPRALMERVVTAFSTSKRMETLWFTTRTKSLFGLQILWSE